MTRMHLFSSAALLTTAVAIAGCGSSGGGSSSSGPSHGAAAAPTGGSTVVRATKTPLGTVLVDGGGHTLYAFAKDTGPKSMCAGSCAANWPPFTASALPKAAGGVQASQLSLAPRGGGARQVAIAGHPLYFFAGDQSAGQFNGQGQNAFGARWWVVSPAGGDVMKAAPGSASTSTSTSSSAPAYGY